MSLPRSEAAQSALEAEMNRSDLKDSKFLAIAEVVGSLSTCDRASVGAVIVRDGRCVSWGFNGAPPGLPHCDENGHGWGTCDNSGRIPIRELSDEAVAKFKEQERYIGHEKEPPWDWQGAVDYLSQKFGCRNATHAEANALAFAAREGISTAGGMLYVSVSPCEVCSHLLIAAGIKRVVWSTEYRDPAGLNLLAEAGVELL